MSKTASYIDESVLLEDRYYYAGQKVAPGLYVEVESRRIVQLAETGRLPASCNGRVAAYIQPPVTWALQSRSSAESAMERR